ncbi:MAG: sulfotransferase, partial [Acidimicrobiia bacterium]|nr:sulfotransferase [Acidimicrobiia bacterium]
MSPTGRAGLEAPILVGGLSNTGKTPVRRILEAHPDLWFSRRTYLWPRFQGRFGDLAEPENVQRLLDAVLTDPGGQALQPEPASIRAEFDGGPPTYARFFGVLYSQHARRLGARRWGVQVKSIEGLADSILTGLPAAVMLHLVRDPRTRSAG